MSFNYGEVLKKAWQIVWKYKVLWIFGILASCGRGNGGSGNGGGSSGGNGGGGGNGFPGGVPNEINRFFDNIEPWMVVLLVLGLILFILLMIFITNYVSTIGRIGLVKGTMKGDKDAPRLTFAELLQTGGPLFWKVFWLNLLAGLVVLFATFILLIPLLGFTVLTAGIGALCLLPLICLLVPVSWVISIYLEQANISLVVEESSIREALSRAWELVKKNIQVYVVMALILGVLGFIVGAVLILPVFAAVFPVLGALVLGGTGGGDAGVTAAIVIALACCVIYFPLMLVASGIITSYVTSAWTLTYLRLTRPNAVASFTPAPDPSS